MFTITSTCKGGGYMYCRTIPKHPRANSKGLYPLHRVLVENKLGRLLKPSELVHHRDHNKGNNTIENLMVMSNSEHSRLHRPYIKDIECKCPECGRMFFLSPRFYRLRLKRNKSGALYCSRSCGSVAGNRIKK